jgi:gamma-glutamylcysteine synthetase
MSYPPGIGAFMSQKKQITEYSQKLFSLLKEKIKPGPETFGFEYEFLPGVPLNLDMMQQIYSFLPEKGFKRQDAAFIHKSGINIDFEPGGQIEFHTLPLFAHERERFNECLSLIKDTLSVIKNDLGIEYLPQGFIPGRKDSPLCLDSKRYIDLHNRLSMCGTRGLEMMKGTASIHLHAGIKGVDELPLILAAMIKMSEMDEFKMGPDRRDIWNNTDPSRCGQPYIVKDDTTPFEVIEKIVEHACMAYHIGKNLPFLETDDLSFDAFMYHLTTIFTDIRLNIKGPSIELRTIDSVPLDQFETKWLKFIKVLQENIYHYKGETP